MGSSDLVVPFRGERYRDRERLTSLIAPPYDVISPAERVRLAARDDHNIVHVMLPEAPQGWTGGDRYAWAAEQLTAWRRAAVLVADDGPALYVMAQTFPLPTGERRTRLGVFGALAAEGYGPRRVRPHEQTHAGPKADRLALLRATHTNVESLFLLAPDRDGALAAALQQVTAAAPDAETELDDVVIRFWVVQGDALSRFPLPASPLYMADGHHRYETASAYAAENPRATRVLAFVASARDPGLVVLPTHRVVFGPGREPARLLERWRAWFDVAPVPAGVDPVAHLAAIGRDRTACLVAGGGGVTALTLKPAASLDTVSGASDAVRGLDVARIEALVVRELLTAGESTPTLTYTADSREALSAAPDDDRTAVLLNPTKVEQVFAVADAGDVMPPKSTYFAPKVPAGLVLADVNFPA